MQGVASSLTVHAEEKSYSDRLVRYYLGRYALLLGMGLRMGHLGVGWLNKRGMSSGLDDC